MEIDKLNCASYNHQAIRVIRLYVLTAAIIVAFLFTSIARAQDETATDSNGDGVTDILEVGVVPQEVISDFEVSLADLEIEEAGILPNSPLHAFKRFGWGIHEALTFDPIADAELKLKHSNQFLGEARQLIDEQGIENINPGVLSSTINRFENKFEDVKETAQGLIDQRTDNPEAVEDLLNKVTDKQIKHQQILDNMAEDVIEIKQEAVDRGEEIDVRIETIISQVEGTKDKAIGDFTELLTEVDVEPERIRVRIEQTLENQGGSEFKSLKNLEFLESIHSKAPFDIQEALDQAKKNTIQRFEIRIAALPEETRGQRFENYIEHATLDETRLVSILEEIKQSTGIPDDLLFKLEEAKEIAVRRFEGKLRLIDDVRVEEKYFNRFDTDDVGDLIAMEEFRNRMTTGSEEFRLMEQEHSASVDGFVARFSDSESQGQAERFQKLQDEMLNNPSPKTFKLMKELEAEVFADPEKRAFLENMETAMTQQFETRFRREGDNFMNRITTLDPNDIGFFDDFDFGDPFRDRYVEHNVDRFKDYMQDVDDPENFDRFHERFFDVGDFVINEIRDRDPGFQDAMQFKVRKMEEIRAEQEREITSARLDFEEREIYHQSYRLQRQKEDEFWNTINDLPWDDFDARNALWDEKINDDYSRVDARFTDQKRIFEERMTNDPWCDSVCQQIQLQFMEQDLRHEQERLADDLSRERNRIELEKVQFEQDNPLANVCSTPEECDNYCRNNPGVRGCEWQSHEPVYLDPDPGYIDCPEGQYYDGFSCVFDPYYRPPTDFKNCDPGFFWNDRFGYCEPEFSCASAYFAPPRDCNPGEVPQPPAQNDFCGQPSCIARNTTICPDLSVMMPLSCPDGQVREIVKDGQGCAGFGGCVTTCSSDEYWDVGANGCVPIINEEYCGDNICSSSETSESCAIDCGGTGGTCPANVYNDYTSSYSCSYTECASGCQFDDTGCATGCWEAPTCSSNQYNDFTESSICSSKACANGCNYDGLGCPVGCLASGGTCADNIYNNNTGSYTCNYSECSNGCTYDGSYCPIGCAAVIPEASVCGDGVCASDESSSTCSADCGSTTVTDVCGDNICGSTESSSTCSSDCGGTTSSCDYDYTCETGEDPVSCADCSSSTVQCSSDEYWDSDANGCVSSTGSGDYGACTDLSEGSCGSTSNCCWYSDSSYNYCYYDSMGCDIDYEDTASSSYCGDGTCDSDEDSSSCSEDCGAVEGVSVKRVLKPEYNPFNVFKPVKQLLGI